MLTANKFNRFSQLYLLFNRDYVRVTRWQFSRRRLSSWHSHSLSRVKYLDIDPDGRDEAFVVVDYRTSDTMLREAVRVRDRLMHPSSWLETPGALATHITAWRRSGGRLSGFQPLRYRTADRSAYRQVNRLEPVCSNQR